MDEFEGSRRESYDQLYGGLYDRFPQETRWVGSARLAMICADQESHSTSDPAINDIVLRLVTKGLNDSSVNCGDGRRALSGQVGSLYLAPDAAVADWTADGDHQILLLALPRPYVATLLSQFGKVDPLGPHYGRDIHDAGAASLMTRIWDLGAQEGPAAALMADGLIMTLLGTLVDMGEAGHHRFVDSPLDPSRLSRVRDAIESSLSETLSVEQMAAIACLSPAHFSRRFHAATGATPHAYVLSRRIEAARRLLVETDDTLADIATACGFSGQSHFTSTFRAITGLPPGRWRRQALLART